MKRIFALLLTLAMAVSLMACGSGDKKAIEEAQALIDSGDYESAIELLTSIEQYQQITGMLDEAVQLMQEQERQEQLAGADFLCGTWVCIDDMTTTLTYREDGTCSFADQYDTWDSNFAYDNGVVTGILDTFTLGEYQGVPCLSGETFGRNLSEGEFFAYRFVKEEDYEALGPKTVEITMENWEEYFELREIRLTYLNDFDEIDSIGFGYGIYLKEEYVEKLYTGYEAVSVAFKMEYDWRYRRVTNPTQDDYVIGGVAWTADHKISTSQVFDYRYSEYIGVEQPEYNAVCATFGSAGPIQDNDIFPSLENGVVIDVQGALILFP